MKADDLSSVTDSHDDFSISSCTRDEDNALGGGTLTPLILGRDRERFELLEVYQLVCQTHESQIVFVHGTSGQGKTSLVDTLREPVCETNGYFCSGKFFQDQEIQEPYSALTAAFSDLCDLVVQSPEFDTQSPDFDEESQLRIQEFLSIHGHLLSRSVNLFPFFSGDSTDQCCFSSSSAEKATTFARFRAACKAFLLTMTSRKHPLVLFIDDTQWMDEGSEKLLDLMQDDDIKNVMFVLSYRDEEASAVEGILQSCEREKVTDIRLSNLDMSGVRQILARRLGSASRTFDELAELTYQRTGGNPFFVSLFLETLEAEKFLTMNGKCLTFDVDEIRRSIMIAESIADCLSRKVSRLPGQVRDVLTVASLIGYSFEEDMLFGVIDTIPGRGQHGNIASLLTIAVDGGFIERTSSKGGYQFAHDKVQSTFQGLVDTATREHLHFRIGKMFLAKMNEGSIYNAAVHLNVAPGFLGSKQNRILLARVNLDASKVCKQSSAFDMSVSLLRRGIELLDSVAMKWSSKAFGLSLALTESLARMSLLVGDFDTCFDAVREAMLHVNTKEQQVSLLLVNVECRMAINDMKGSIKASREALSELGVKLPTNLGMPQAIFKLMRVKLLMAGKTHGDILSLPFIKDGSTTADAVRLLIHITFYSILINDVTTGLYTGLLATELTVQNGLSTFAAPALANFAVAILRLGNVERAYSLGKLAVKLMEQNPSREADCPTLGFVNPLILHWKEPVSILRDPLVNAAAAGLEMGDVIYSTYCVLQGINLDGFNGTHLEVFERSIQSQYDRIHSLGQDQLLEWIRPYMQYVANLRSSSTDWYQLSSMAGDFIDLSESNASSNLVLVVAGTAILKARLANAFGLHAIARGIFEELEPLGHVLNPVIVFNLMCWDACIAYYEGFLADGKRKHLRKARKYKEYLKKRDQTGPNASIFLRHLNMRETFMRRRTDSSESQHDETLIRLDCELESISLSNSFCYVVARAFTDAGSVAAGMGRLGKARQYFERSREVYIEQWGAFAPAACLEDTHVSCHPQNMLVCDIVQFDHEEK